MRIDKMTKVRNNTTSPKRSLMSSSSPSLFIRLLLVAQIVLLIAATKFVAGFSISSSVKSHHQPTLVASSSFSSRLLAGDSAVDGYDDDIERDREFARVRRRRGRGDYDEDEVDYDSREAQVDSDRRGGRGSDYSVMDAADMLEDEGFFDDMDDDYDDDESYDMFSNTVIPNPILDSIDPDGSADRFPELASDPRFWFDMFLFIAFLNFVSFVGPRNPFPDMIPAMYTAGLPPPGM